MVQRVLRNTKPRPRFIGPMEGRRVPKLAEGDWVYEIKPDRGSGASTVEPGRG